MDFSCNGDITFPAFISLFLYSFIFGKVSLLRKYITLAFPLLALIFFLIAKDRYEIFLTRSIFFIFVIYIIIDLIIISIRQLTKKETKGLGFLFSLVSLIIFGIHDILAFGFSIIPPTVSLVFYGLPFLQIIISIYLTNRFIESLNETEKLNRVLNHLKTTFEKFVPKEFLNFLNKNDISLVSKGDSTQIEMHVLFLDI